MGFMATPKESDIKAVEIICPVCDSDRVEPLYEPDGSNSDRWQCCGCEQAFKVIYAKGVN